ncbi:hypothetical protein VNI00_000610 [Paramarasmius palmivorus]|uniref:F-box domain-containing protein n=1 Tax=Paramarasmius palmivorus TaxID=297713 RepID=A0AAW0EBS2_9AGAR
MAKTVQTRNPDFLKVNTVCTRRQQAWPIAPILRLPNELSLEIFLYAVFGATTSKEGPSCAEHDHLPFNHRSPHNTPLIHTTREALKDLARVCLGWHNLILSAPYLRSFVSFDVYEGENIDALRVLLERAAERPFNIELTDLKCVNYPDSDPFEAWEAYDTFLETSRMWKSLRFALIGQSFMFNEPPKGADPSFPLLESLVVDRLVRPGNVLPYDDTSHWFFGALRDAKRLTTIQIQDPFLLDIVSCHQLTSLEIHVLNCTFERIVQILQTCQNLDRLVLNSWTAQSNNEPQIEVLRHERLHHLSISVRGKIHESITSLFDSLILPSLTELQVMYEPRELEQSYSSHALIGMLQRSACILKALTAYVNVVSMLETFVSDLLPGIPSVSYLDVTFVSEDRDEDLEYAVVRLLWSLAVRRSNRSPSSPVKAVLLPQLLDIRIRHSSTCTDVVTATDGGLEHLASSRSWDNLVALGCHGNVLPLVTTSQVIWRPPKICPRCQLP